MRPAPQGQRVGRLHRGRESAHGPIPQAIVLVARTDIEHLQAERARLGVHTAIP